MTQKTREKVPSLVVVSNRLPYNVPFKQGGRPPKRNVGGLVNAVEPILVAMGGRWVGWDGSHLRSGEAVSTALANPQAYRTPSGIDLYGVPLSDNDVRHFYHGFANRALWPLFHVFPGKSNFALEDYSAYAMVNRRFAQIALSLAGSPSTPNTRIWVHDFHLMLVPYFLREAGFQGQIDFFLHIPFPPLEVFKALPWREELLRGLLASDSIAFHVKLYRDNFVVTASELLKAKTKSTRTLGVKQLQHKTGKTSVSVVPIGIDVGDFERIASLPQVESRMRRMKESYRDCKILFAIDRLDYTKGIKERLNAVEWFLTKHREALRKVTFLQVVVPSRHQVAEYRSLKRDIDREVGRINGRLGREGWVPIHYRYVALERYELVACYRAADVALVTPLRDGMNMVASEFAASRIDEDGILIVSEFAGVAEHAPGAILVNPYNKEGFANAIANALNMSPKERNMRMCALRAEVRRNPVSQWAERCLGFDRLEHYEKTTQLQFEGNATEHWTV